MTPSSWAARPGKPDGIALVDALRGLAILAVFVQHLGDRFLPTLERAARFVPGATTLLHHAFAGVDLFFVVSGFSLAFGFLKAADRGARVDVRAFYMRRLRRLVPAYAAALALKVLIGPTIVLAPGFPRTLATYACMMQGYSPPPQVLIGAAWSLTTELHFYLLLPLIAPLLVRGRRRAVVAALGLSLLAWVTRALLHALVLEPGMQTYALELTQRRLVTSRLDQFVLGALAAAIVHRGWLPRRAAPFVVTGSIAAVFVGLWLEGELYFGPYGALPYPLVSLGMAGLVLGAVLLPDRVQARLSPRLLVHAGVVSYGFFLVHQLALGLAGAWLGRLGIAGIGPLALLANAALALALGFGWARLSWAWVERPLLR